MSNSAVKQQSNHESGLKHSWNNRILVVDDELNIGEGIKALLSPAVENVIPFRRSSRIAPAPTAVVSTESVNAAPLQYEVVVVDSPTKALDAVKASIANGKPFAMGFFDVLLNAQIDGIELVRQVFALDENIQAVFVTAYNDRSVDSISNFLGEANTSRWDYLNKPFTDGEILQKARNVVSLWNLRQQKLELDERLNEAQKWLLENERANTVAAVSRSFAHEFGNLMTQIIGHCELALLKQDSARMKEALEVILKASETANNILGKFKNVSENKIKSTQDTNGKKLINLAQVITDSLELMSFQFRKTNIKVDKKEFEQVLIEGNKHSIIQVLMNIFINATHSMPEGGTIEISLKKLEGDEVYISIRDTGNGIPEEYLDKVLLPMFTTKGEKGSGLGLSICKEIIEIEHHGEFKIGNHKDKGALVEIKLPLRSEN